MVYGSDFCPNVFKKIMNKTKAFPYFCTKKRMIKAVIFDMDGLLIDSEPIWREAEIKIFGVRGVFITEDDCRGTTGMRVDEVVAHWSLKFPEAQLDLKETEQAIMNEVCNLVEEKGKALIGVIETIGFFKQRNIPIAIGSASSNRLINKVIEKLNIQNAFSVIQSAEFMTFGKPHPEVFIEAAKKLGVRPEECLVFEDSVYGVIAGKAAKMKVIAVPDAENYNKIGYCIADKKIDSLSGFTDDIWLELNS